MSTAATELSCAGQDILQLDVPVLCNPAASVKFHNCKFERIHCDVSILAPVPYLPPCQTPNSLPRGCNLESATTVLFEECKFCNIRWNGVTIRHRIVARLKTVILQSLMMGLGQNAGIGVGFEAIGVDLRAGAVVALHKCQVIGCRNTGIQVHTPCLSYSSLHWFSLLWYFVCTTFLKPYLW